MQRRAVAMAVSFAVLLFALRADRARAEDQAAAPPPAQANAALSPHAAQLPAEPAHAWVKPGLVGFGLALVPGIALHGAGSFAIGERKTALRLISAEAAGLLVLVGAGALMRETGTARSWMGVLTPLAIFGFGTFALSWVADVYAASTGGREAYGPRFVPNVEVELGYLYVHDPQFAYGSFAAARADLRVSAFRATPQAFVALDADNQRLLLELAYRPWGRTPARRFADGSFLELATGVRYHRFGSDEFAVTTSEWHLDGRLDLARVGKALRGSFVEGQLGAALELYHFDAPGSRLENNVFSMLLARFGFGVYVGTGPRSGEALVYYDHRHDDFAAGLGVKGIASGPLGHFGVSGRYFLTEAWGASALLEVGSAVVAGLNLCYRYAAHGGGG